MSVRSGTLITSLISFSLARVVLVEQVQHMPKRSSNKNSIKKNPAAVALGRLGGLKGGPARSKKLSAKQRSEIARMAVLVRWRKKTQ